MTAATHDTTCSVSSRCHVYLSFQFAQQRVLEELQHTCPTLVRLSSNVRRNTGSCWSERATVVCMRKRGELGIQRKPVAGVTLALAASALFHVCCDSPVRRHAAIATDLLQRSLVDNLSALSCCRKTRESFFLNIETCCRAVTLNFSVFVGMYESHV